MASVNKVVLVGNLGADPELRLLPSGDSVANFGVATKDRRIDGKGGYIEVTEWHRISLYGKQAEVARKYLKKGSQVYIDGRLRSSVWTDRNGLQHKTWVVIADHMQMLGKPEHRLAEAAAPTEDAMAWMAGPTPDDSTTGHRQAATPNTFDDDIPF